MARFYLFNTKHRSYVQPGADDTEIKPLSFVVMNAVGPQYSGPESILTDEVEPTRMKLILILSTNEKGIVSDGQLVQVRVFKKCLLSLNYTI